MKPDFDSLLKHTASAYDSQVGDWWAELSSDESHQKAYHHIANVIEPHQEPLNILDYACGSGELLKHFSLSYPQATLFGVDASEKMLGPAQKLVPQAKLKQVNLPCFSGEIKDMDLVSFCFPNLIADEKSLETFNENGYENNEDAHIATLLTEFQDTDSAHIEKEDFDEVYDDLMTHRVFSRNLRSFLKTGGYLIKTEYTNATFAELSPKTRLRSQFMDGSLETPIYHNWPKPFFRKICSTYTPSAVILDVYHQTQDESDKVGGYNLHIYKALPWEP